MCNKLKTAELQRWSNCSAAQWLDCKADHVTGGGGSRERERVSSSLWERDKSKAKTLTDMAQHGWSWMMQTIKTLSCLTFFFFFLFKSRFTLSPLSHQPGCRTPTSEHKARLPASPQKDDDVHVTHSYEAQLICPTADPAKCSNLCVCMAAWFGCLIKW